MTPEEFLTAKLSAAREEMGDAILNRGRWEKLRDDCRMLVFLQERTEAVDFQGVRGELQRIAEGRIGVPDISGPRRKAEDCLQHWAKELEGLDR